MNTQKRTYGVFANLVTGLNLFSTHKSLKKANRIALSRSVLGFPCVVKVIK